LLRSQSDAVRVESIYRIKLRKLGKDAVIFYNTKNRQRVFMANKL